MTSHGHHHVIHKRCISFESWRCDTTCRVKENFMVDVHVDLKIRYIFSLWIKFQKTLLLLHRGQTGTSIYLFLFSNLPRSVQREHRNTACPARVRLQLLLWCCNDVSFSPTSSPLWFHRFSTRYLNLHRSRNIQ